MAEDENLRGIVADLIDVLYLEAKELEALVMQIEQIAGRVPEVSRLPPIVSQLSELKSRIKAMRTPR